MEEIRIGLSQELTPEDKIVLNEFGSPSRESGVIDYFMNHPKILYKSPPVRRKLVESNGRYYHLLMSRGLCNLSRGRILKILEYNQINVETSISQSYGRLLGIIDEEISLGEKMLLKKIAGECFLGMLKFALEDKSSSYGLGDCISLDKNEMAYVKLETYGFKIRPPKRIRFFS